MRLAAFEPQDELLDGEDTASCPSCSLRIRVVYEDEDLEEFEEVAGGDA